MPVDLPVLSPKSHISSGPPTPSKRMLEASAKSQRLWATLRDRTLTYKATKEKLQDAEHDYSIYLEWLAGEKEKKNREDEIAGWAAKVESAKQDKHSRDKDTAAAALALLRRSEMKKVEARQAEQAKKAQREYSRVTANSLFLAKEEEFRIFREKEQQAKLVKRVQADRVRVRERIERCYANMAAEGDANAIAIHSKKMETIHAEEMRKLKANSAADSETWHTQLNVARQRNDDMRTVRADLEGELRKLLREQKFHDMQVEGDAIHMTNLQNGEAQRQIDEMDAMRQRMASRTEEEWRIQEMQIELHDRNVIEQKHVKKRALDDAIQQDAAANRLLYPALTARPDSAGKGARHAPKAFKFINANPTPKADDKIQRQDIARQKLRVQQDKLVLMELNRELTPEELDPQKRLNKMVNGPQGDASSPQSNLSKALLSGQYSRNLRFLGALRGDRLD